MEFSKKATIYSAESIIIRRKNWSNAGLVVGILTSIISGGLLLSDAVSLVKNGTENQSDDEENYDEAILSLTEVYTTTALDRDVAHLLASAYMGKAGIDLTDFISYIDLEDADAFDSISSMLDYYIFSGACNLHFSTSAKAERQWLRQGNQTWR